MWRQLFSTASLQLGTFGAAILLVVFIVILAAVVLYFVLWALRRKPVTGVEAMKGKIGVAVSALSRNTDGEVSVEGVIWKARIAEGASEARISKEESITVMGVSSLTLLVQKTEQAKQS